MRTPGTGHSFTPVNESNGTLVDLSAFTGLKDFDAEQQTATLAAATPLWEIGPLLHAKGFALKNMGDIDRQTLGGVVGTGTHGTGRTLRSFSAEVAGFRLLLASGEVLHCARERERGDVRCRAHLDRRARRDDRDHDECAAGPTSCSRRTSSCRSTSCFARLDRLVADNRHFEFFWFPYADVAVCKTLNESSDPAPEPRAAE